MLLLFETPAGYSLFKVKDEDKLKDIDVRLSICSSSSSSFAMMMMSVFCFPAANSFFLGAINEQKIPFCRFSTRSVTFSFYSATSSSHSALVSFVFSPSLSFTSDGCCVVKSGGVRENTLYS